MISPRDRDRAHAVLRLPAALARRDPRLQDALPPLHGARTGLLRREPQADPEGRRRRGLRRRLADRARSKRTRSAVENLRTNLAEQGYSLDKIPYVIQYNKRDLPNVVDGRRAARSCSTRCNVPDFEAVARTGVGVFDTLKAVSKLVLTELKRGG